MKSMMEIGQGERNIRYPLDPELFSSDNFIKRTKNLEETQM